MRLWRLSTATYAKSFNGGYGRDNDGRWNTKGRPVTYCATVPSLCVLEKLVHVGRPENLPDGLVMLQYEAPDDIAIDHIELDDLPAEWLHDEAVTRQRGDAWLEGLHAPILRVPSVIVAEPGAADRNMVVNHLHPDHVKIRPLPGRPFAFDPRLWADTAALATVLAPGAGG